MWEKISGWFLSMNEPEQVEEPSIGYEKMLAKDNKVRRADLITKTLLKWNEDNRIFDEINQLDKG